MKKVLGLIVSHRRSGNSEILVKEIMNSIPEECNRELIRLTDLEIKPCQACYRCVQPGNSCRLQDDFNFVVSKIKEADALIVGVPVYFLGPHGYYKMLADRLLGVQNQSKDTKGKPCVMVVPYGAKGWQGYSKAACLVMPNLLRMKLVDCWQVKAALPGESLLNSENIDYARTLGRGLFSGRIYQAGSRECPNCGSDLLRLLDENRIECPICGSKGVMKSNCQPDFSDSGYFRFSDREMDEHFSDWLLKMKKNFLVEKERLKKLQKDYCNLDWWIRP